MDLELIFCPEVDLNWLCRGFSMIDLVESTSTRRKYALKRMTCHSKEDEEVVRQEINVMTTIDNKNVIRLIDFMFKGTYCLSPCPDH